MRFPSRGGARVRILVGSKRAKGTPTLRRLRIDDHGVLEATSRRGTFVHLVMRRRMRGEGRSFARGVSAHVKALSSFQPAAAASDDWFDAPSASGAPKSDDLRGFNLAARLQRRVASSVGLCVTHLPTAFERRRLAQFVRLRKRPYEERRRTRRPRRRDADRNVRGEDWSLVGCARASFM